MSSLVIIQARMSSSRFPRKVLKKLNQKPLLEWMIERVQRCEEVDKVVIATSTNNDDDEINEWCNNHNIHCYRGDLDNVLARFYYAATYYQADVVIRLTADCPIIDPKIIDEHIRFYRENSYDYVSNGPEMTYPDGMGVEVFSYLTLQKVFQQATLTSEKEHVTAFIYNHPNDFRLYNVKYEQDFSWIRVTVDYPEDFILIEKLVNGLLPNDEFTLKDIINYIKDHPDLLNINNQYSPNEGYELSLLNDNLKGNM